jgi:aminoglycoside 3-N-acetyltransferase I
VEIMPEQHYISKAKMLDEAHRLSSSSTASARSPRMRCTYRQLSGKDLSLFKELLAVFGEAFEEPETYQGAVPSDEYLRALLDKQHFIALVALDEGKVVGGLAAYVLDKFERDRREMYIYDLAVDAGSRRKGVAAGLVNALQDVAAARDIYVIFVQADKEDTPAIKLYESLGVKEDVFHFDIPVRGSRSGARAQT